MHGPNVQLMYKGRKIGGMGLRRVVLPIVRPLGRAVVAKSAGYEAMVRSDPLALRLPIPKIHPGPMDKDDWRTITVIDVGQVYAIHPQFWHSPLRSPTPAPFGHVILAVQIIHLSPSGGQDKS